MRRLLFTLLTLVPCLSWAGVVWRGDFETGDVSQYSGSQRVSVDRLQVVTTPSFGGRYALKATVRQGDDPINSSGNRNELVYQGNEREGSEYYYRWQVYFPSDYPSVNTWQVFTQWHHEGCCGSPPVEFFVKGEEMRLTLTDSVTPWKAKLVRGAWQDFIFHVKWSSDNATGFVELWHNGQLVLSKYKHATMYPNDGIYLKLGLYRSDTVAPVGVVYHDGFTQATQLSDVQPSSTTPAPQDNPAPSDGGTPTPGPSDGGTPTPGPSDGGTPTPGPSDAGTPSPDETPVGSSTPSTPSTPSTGTNGGAPPLDDIQLRGCSSSGGSLGVLSLLSLLGLGTRRWRRRS